MAEATFSAIAGLSEAGVREALEGGEPRVRLLAAWVLGVRAGRGKSGAGAEPSVAERRHFPMAFALAKQGQALGALVEFDPDPGVRAGAGQFLARLVEPRDGAAYAVLCRVAGRDESDAVRAAVVANLRDDAPTEVRARDYLWLRDRSAEVGQAAAERMLAWEPDVRSALERICRVAPVRLEATIKALRGREPPVVWADVEPAARQGLPVLMAIASLFAKRRGEPPLSFWLCCVKHARALMDSPKDMVALIVDATTAAGEATPAGALDAEARTMLDQALAALTEALPVFDHHGYLELRAAGLLRHPLAPPSSPLTSRLARLWAVLIKLSPSPEGYRMVGRYK